MPMSKEERVNLKLTYLQNKLTLISSLSKNIITHSTLRKVHLIARLLDLVDSILIMKSSVNVAAT